MVITAAKWNKEPCDAALAKAILLWYLQKQCEMCPSRQHSELQLSWRKSRCRGTCIVDLKSLITLSRTLLFHFWQKVRSCLHELRILFAVFCCWFGTVFLAMPVRSYCRLEVFSALMDKMLGMCFLLTA